MNIGILRKTSFVVGLVLITGFYGCDNGEEPLSSADKLVVENEAAVEFAFEDADDMMLSSLAVLDASAGRTTNDEEGANDDRWSQCAQFTFEKTGELSGTITIDFGDGCQGPAGRTRSGKIMISFEGRRWLMGSVISTVFENYSIAPDPDRPDFVIGLEGTRTVTNVMESLTDAPTFSITLTGGVATFPDGTTHTREVNRTKTWIRGASPISDSWEVEGVVTGKNRNDVEYNVQIVEPLVFKRICIFDRVFIPVSGIKTITTDVRTVTVDYGDGECDNIVTITVDGVSNEVDLAELRS